MRLAKRLELAEAEVTHMRDTLQMRGLPAGGLQADEVRRHAGRRARKSLLMPGEQ